MDGVGVQDIACDTPPGVEAVSVNTCVGCLWRIREFIGCALSGSGGGKACVTLPVGEVKIVLVYLPMTVEHLSAEGRVKDVIPSPWATRRNDPDGRRQRGYGVQNCQQTLMPLPQTIVTREISGQLYHFGCPVTHEQRDWTLDLVERRYGWRGYDPIGALNNASRSDEVTFMAVQGQSVDGTLTVRIDHCSRLLAEDLYPEEVAQLRHRGARLCEFGRLAFETGVSTLDILGPLFHLGMLYARQVHDCTDMIVEVHPRHVGFYQRVFGFEVFGTMKNCERVAAPAVLLRLSLTEASFLATIQGGERAGRRSIYPYCLSEDERNDYCRELEAISLRGEDFADDHLGQWQMGKERSPFLESSRRL